MSKALKIVSYLLGQKLTDKGEHIIYDDELKVIEKELKALEIIKETWNITFFDEELRIFIDNCYSISFKNEDKYNILKEVLL